VDKEETKVTNVREAKEDAPPIMELVLSLKELGDKRHELTEAAINEMKEKIAANHQERTRKGIPSSEFHGLETEDDKFPKYDERSYMTPRTRVLESARPIQRQRANLDTPRDELILDYQRAVDELSFIATFMESRDKTKYRQRFPDGREVWNLKAIEQMEPKLVDKVRFYAKQIDPEFARAMDTGTEMANWLETQWTASMTDLVRTEYVVGGLFPHINMPSVTYDMPLEGTDLTPTLVGEGTNDPMASDWHEGAVAESDSTVGKNTLTARKFGCRSVISDEATADTILPVMPYISKKHTIAHAFALDEAITDGQRTAQIDTGINGGSIATSDRRYAWDGLRYIATTVKTSATKDLSTFNFDNLMALKAKMGAYGRRTRELRFLTGYSGLYNFTLLDQCKTIDVYGMMATILKGTPGGYISDNEAARLFDIPIVLCPNTIWEQLTPAGIYDNSTKTKTCLLLVHTPSFIVGDRQGYTYRVLSELYAAHGMVGVVSFSRYAFKDLHAGATDLDVVYGYNIALAA